MTDALQLRDNARTQLLQIKDLETGVNYLNKIKTIETWVKAEKKDAELQNMVAEQKLRTQRILGNLLKEDENIKQGNPAGSNGREIVKSKPTTLQDYGLSKDQSSTFQKIASIPDKTFEGFIKEKKEAVDNAVAELTTSGAVKLAKSLSQKKQDIETNRSINERLDMERELRALAVDLKKKYSKENINLLIKFLTK